MLSTAILTEFDTVQNLKKKEGEIKSGVHNSISLTREYVNNSKKSLLRIYI